MKNKTCDALGCTGMVSREVISHLHPVDNRPIVRGYCFVHTPVHCPKCKMSVGIKRLRDDRLKNKKTITYYLCRWCENKFSILR